MKSNFFRSIVVAFVFLGLAASVSSCNRGGYGCPYELKVTPTVIKAIIK